MSSGRLDEMLNRTLSRAASTVKRSDYRLDPAIPATSLLQLAYRRAVMWMRGRVRFVGRPHKPFVGAHVTIRARSSLTFGAGVTFADGSVVDALSRSGVRLGSNVSVGRNTRIECTGTLRAIGVGLDVGDDVGLGTDSLYGCAGGIAIGSDTIVGNFVSFHSENHNIDALDRPIRTQGETHTGITIGRNCWIGARCTILDGADVGDGCVIAAGSVVTAGRYEADGVYGGIPARLLRKRGSR